MFFIISSTHTSKYKRNRAEKTFSGGWKPTTLESLQFCFRITTVSYYYWAWKMVFCVCFQILRFFIWKKIDLFQQDTQSCSWASRTARKFARPTLQRGLGFTLRFMRCELKKLIFLIDFTCTIFPKNNFVPFRLILFKEPKKQTLVSWNLHANRAVEKKNQRVLLWKRDKRTLGNGKRIKHMQQKWLSDWLHVTDCGKNCSVCVMILKQFLK